LLQTELGSRRRDCELRENGEAWARGDLSLSNFPSEPDLSTSFLSSGGGGSEVNPFRRSLAESVGCEAVTEVETKQLRLLREVLFGGHCLGPLQAYLAVPTRWHKLRPPIVLPGRIALGMIARQNRGRSDAAVGRQFPLGVEYPYFIYLQFTKF
jgi:hypothetical protein